MKIGFLINPWAGIGGTVALKGSDGEHIRSEALARGAQPRAHIKAQTMVQAFLAERLGDSPIAWYSAAGAMGADVLADLKVPNVTVIPIVPPLQTEAADSQAALAWMLNQQLDVLVFAGGDGTARDVFAVLGDRVPVIGIPAGVKIHSAVFAVTAHAAGEVLAGLVAGRLTEVRHEEVRDIDEAAFRNHQVRSTYFGDMLIPVAGEFMQQVKVGGIESDELVLSDIADWLEKQLDPERLYLIGSGKTTATLMDHLDIPNSLLGIDAIKAGRLIQGDCTEADLLALLADQDATAIVSIIGGQGHILGRGNPQFSPTVLARLGKENLWVVGSKGKLRSLDGRPLLIDSGEPALDRQWAGLVTVITGYDDRVIYPLVAR
ncbi:ATP-NAD kinase family protein [Reinekea sp.]|jgi:predicted polyphosphate/ATP-dependent NAD kinase|uniref:ATP-NAD kinase family protein n=1 Tax=Reinekea sp. TaxID=1970455 RepID=UPI002A82A839|nr:ATP-NAD kinase family protein [Reinekea sp.]